MVLAHSTLPGALASLAGHAESASLALASPHLGAAGGACRAYRRAYTRGAMTARGWRYTSLVLMVAVAILVWRDCRRPRAAGKDGHTSEQRPSARAASRAGDRAGSDAPARRAAATGEGGDELAGDGTGEHDEPPALGPDLRQQIAQHWVVRFLTPHPGETLLEYRDRVVPAAQLAVAPHRARVAESRQRFVEEAALDAEQQRVLDAAVQRSADDIKDHVMQSVLSGELLPPRVRPARAVAFARDVLDLLDRADREFRAALSPEQLALLDAGGFDVVDYLFFSTRWEDLLGVVE